MKQKRGPSERSVYQAPGFLVGIFYAFLVGWSGAAILALGRGGDSLWLFMIAFVLAFTWYFSLGLAYRIELGVDGTIEWTSYRRVVKLPPREVRMIEGPFLPVGFLRFRLEREKIYLLCVATDKVLQSVIQAIVKMNPEIRVKTN
jgi:hypothetical protein